MALQCLYGAPSAHLAQYISMATNLLSMWPCNAYGAHLAHYICMTTNLLCMISNVALQCLYGVPSAHLAQYICMTTNLLYMGHIPGIFSCMILLNID